MRLSAIAVALIVSTLAGVSAFGAVRSRPATSATSCANYIVIDSRGSGETTTLSKPGGVFYGFFKAAVLRRDPSARVAVIPNGYPAWGSIPTMISALLKLPQQYYKSVVAGKNWLSNELGVLASSCPGSKLVLAGYSQGAQVTGDVYQNTQSKQVLGVVLFGDPKFNSADSADRGGVSGLQGGAAEVSYGGYGACALLRAGAVKCWGRNDSGQLGIGTTKGPGVCSAAGIRPTPACSTVPLPVQALRGAARAISVVPTFSCALLSSGQVECWGSNERGQLGNDDPAYVGASSLPIIVKGL